jgi:hypothetical protein
MSTNNIDIIKNFNKVAGITFNLQETTTIELKLKRERGKTIM